MTDTAGRATSDVDGLIAADRAKTYPEFLEHLGNLLQQAMPRTDRERDELYAAEAEVRRLKTELAVAKERVDLARERYQRERAVLMEMFRTWKDEVMRRPTESDSA
jgi:hypothetical protein